MNKHITTYYGWYDGPSNSEGNVVLCYWNHIVNTYPSDGTIIGEGPNDPIRYSKENYVNAVLHFINEHHKENPTKKFIIDLPVIEVWWEGETTHSDGYPENIPVWKTLEWIEYVVSKLESVSSIVGWYQADEPEVWGHRELVNGKPLNQNPKIDFYFLKYRYDLISKISKKPVIVVFCDIDFFKSRYEKDIKIYGKFFDVFGFDYYPYKIDRTLPLSNIKKFIKLANSIESRIPIMFVGQSTGEEKFDTREPSIKERKALYKEWTRVCPPSQRFAYLIWSYSYGSELSKLRGNLSISPSVLYRWDWYSKSILGKLFYYIKKLLNL